MFSCKSNYELALEEVFFKRIFICIAHDIQEFMHIMVGLRRRFSGLQQGRDLSSQSGTLNEACTTQDMDIPAINKHNIVTNRKIYVHFNC